MWVSFGTLLLILLLVWWAPTPGLKEPLGIVLTSALLIAGIVAIRHQTNQEFPASEQPTKTA